MITPLKITLKKKITGKVSSKHPDLILDYIKQRFADKKASDFTQEGHKISFKKRLSLWQRNEHLFAAVDGGSFEKAPFAREIIYQFSTARTGYFVISLWFLLLVSTIALSAPWDDIYHILLILPLGYVLNIIILYVRLHWFTDQISRELENL